MLGGQGQRGCWKSGGNGYGREWIRGKGFQVGESTLQHTLARSDAHACGGSKGWRHPGAKSQWANPSIGPGYVGAYLAASPSRDGLAKS